MAEANPYSTPDAVLGSMEEVETYAPVIFAFNGRLGRMRYLAYMMGMYLVMLAAGFVGAMITGVGTLVAGDFSGMPIAVWIVFGVIYIVAVVYSIMVGKRRLNDLNRTGWWQLLYFVPSIISIFFPLAALLGLLMIPLAIYMLFFSGTSGSNDYGPEPEANSVGVLILAWIFIVLTILSIVGVIAAVLIPMLAG